LKGRGHSHPTQAERQHIEREKDRGLSKKERGLFPRKKDASLLYIPIYPLSLHREYRYYTYRERKATYGGRERKRTLSSDSKKEDFLERGLFFAPLALCLNRRRESPSIQIESQGSKET